LDSGSAWASTALTASEAEAQASPFSFVMSAADIPTLGEWALIVLMVAMAAYAFRRLRRGGVLMGAALGLLLLLTASGALLAVGGLASAVHEPDTMLGAPVGHSRSVSVSLTADAGQAVTGMNVHYRKSGDASWKVATGAAAPTGGCPACWAATMNTTGWNVGDTIQYYFEAIVGGASTFAYWTLDASVAGYWKLDGGSAVDTTANGHDGAPVGTVGTAPGAFGDVDGAAAFDGVTTGIRVPDSPGLHLPVATVMVWARVAVDSPDSSVLVCKDTMGTPALGDFTIRLDGPAPTLDVTFSNGTGDAIVLSSTHVVKDGAWHYVAITCSPSGGQLFLDGALEDSSATSCPGLVNSQPLQFGIYDNGSHLKGALDDALLFNRALAPDEIAVYYNSGKPYAN